MRWMSSFADRDALKRALEKADLAWGEVRTSANLLDSPTIAARGVVASVADGAEGTRLVVQSPYRFSDADSGVRAGAPRLGEHNSEVLRQWLRLSDEEVRRLAASGAIAQ